MYLLHKSDRRSRLPPCLFHYKVFWDDTSISQHCLYAKGTFWYFKTWVLLGLTNTQYLLGDIITLYWRAFTDLINWIHSWHWLTNKNLTVLNFVQCMDCILTAVVLIWGSVSDNRIGRPESGIGHIPSPLIILICTEGCSHDNNPRPHVTCTLY